MYVYVRRYVRTDVCLRTYVGAYVRMYVYVRTYVYM